MSVVDFDATRFANDALKHAERLIGEAEFSIDMDEPEQASLYAVEAWMVLNAAAATAHRIKMKKIITGVAAARKKILAMGASLQTLGYTLKTDIPETTMAFVVHRRDT